MRSLSSDTSTYNFRKITKGYRKKAPEWHAGPFGRLISRVISKDRQEPRRLGKTENSKTCQERIGERGSQTRKGRGRRQRLVARGGGYSRLRRRYWRGLVGGEVKLLVVLRGIPFGRSFCSFPNVVLEGGCSTPHLVLDGAYFISAG